MAAADWPKREIVERLGLGCGIGRLKDGAATLIRKRGSPYKGDSQACNMAMGEGEGEGEGRHGRVGAIILHDFYFIPGTYQYISIEQ